MENREHNKIWIKWRVPGRYEIHLVRPTHLGISSYSITLHLMDELFLDWLNCLGSVSVQTYPNYTMI